MKQDLDVNGFVSSLSAAARENPLAAALIGGGALWLMFGNRPINRLASGVAASAQAAADVGMSQASRAAGAIADAGARVAETAADATDNVMNTAGRYASAMRDRAGDAAGRVGDAAGSASDAIGQRTRDFAATGGNSYQSIRDAMPQLRDGYANARSALTELLERQPLALGAIGLALGACIASAAPATSVEKEWIGPLGDEVTGEIKQRAANLAEAGQRVAGEIGNELRSAAADAADIMRTAGTDAVRSEQEKASERSTRPAEGVR